MGMLLTSAEWTLYSNLHLWGARLNERKCFACYLMVLMSAAPHEEEIKEGSFWFGAFFFSPCFFLLQAVTVTEVPPGFPLQTHFCSFRFVLFLSLLLSVSLSKQTHVFVFCLCFVFGWSLLPRLCQSFICPSPPSPLRSLLTCELFQWNIFEFSFISTWLLNLLSCCLYIILILLWFLKFHLYYILGPRDHPDIVDSFMQLQAQVCFWFLISFTLGFSLFLFF